MTNTTALHSLHVEANARMVDFAGWDMPVNYGSQIEEHHAVRKAAGMFDVSHMTAVDVVGEQATAFLQRLLAGDVSKADKGQAVYGCMLAEDGGILDDLITYRISDNRYRIVVNAGTTDKDVAWMQQQIGEFDVTVTPRRDLCIIAVQGPKARQLATALLPDSLQARATNLKPFYCAKVDEWFVGRTGYTGEDGFEIILPARDAPELWQKLEAAGVRPCGLGARDTLRLEAGLNLYGQDMDESTNPLISALGWTIDWEPADRDFIGRRALEAVRASGIPQKLVGLLLNDKGVLRSHQPVILSDGTTGETTSGSFAPTLERSIGFARVPASAAAKVGQQCEVDIRGRKLSATITSLRFVRQGKLLIDLPE